MKKIRFELIGRIAAVVQSTNQSQVGLSGKIVDETQNTIKIRTEVGVKTLLKSQVVLKIDGSTIEGKWLRKRPEERMK